MTRNPQIRTLMLVAVVALATLLTSQAEASYATADTVIGAYREDRLAQPFPRIGASAIFDPGGDQFVIFGGRAGSTGYGTGSSEIYSLPVGARLEYKRVQLASGPTIARVHHKAIYDPIGDRMLVVGGTNTSECCWDGCNSDHPVWALPLDAPPHWEEVVATGPGPAASAQLGSVAMDVTRNQLLVVAFAQWSVELWALNLEGQPTWRPLLTGGMALPAGTKNIAYDEARDRLLIFAVNGASSPEVWATGLDAPMTLSLLATTGAPPAGSTNYEVACDPIGDRLLVLSDTGETWVLTLAGPSVWSKLGAGLPHPPVAGDRCSAIDIIRGRWVVFGGNSSGNYVSQVWSLSLGTTPSWTRLDVGSTPPGRSQASVVFDARRRRLLIFGGHGFADLKNDTWSLTVDGTPRWSRADSASAVRPPIRSVHACVLDTALDRMLLYGGLNPDSMGMSDLWSLQLAGVPQWTRLVPQGATTPGRRIGAQAVWDPVRRRMLLFGGYQQMGNSTILMNDVWALETVDTLRWVQLQPFGVAPEPRWAPAIVYDSHRDQIILFGGTGSSYAYRDTWSLNLSGPPEWNSIATEGEPPAARGAACSIYDPLRQRLFVFGGQSLGWGWQGYGGGNVGDAASLSLSGTPTWTVFYPFCENNHVGQTQAVYDSLTDRMLAYENEQYSTNPSDSLNFQHMLVGFSWNFAAPVGFPPVLTQALGVDFPAGSEGVGVNTAAGAFTHSFTILTLRGPGEPIAIGATYVPSLTSTSLFGPRWTWTLGQRLVIAADSSVTLHLDDGKTERFLPSAAGYSSEAGVYDQILKTATGYDVVTPAGQRMRFDARGMLLAILDRNDNGVTLVYNRFGWLAGFYDSAHRFYTVGNTGRVISITDPLGQAHLFDYNANGMLRSVERGALKAPMVFTYDARGRLINCDDGGLSGASVEYDEQGRVASQWAYGIQTSFVYQDSAHLTIVQKAPDIQRRHFHDMQSRLVSDISERGDTTGYTYDTNHNRLTVREPGTAAARFVYDARGNVVQSTNALGGVVTTAYDSLSDPISRSDENGFTTTSTYDGHGNRTSVTDALGHTTRYTYNAHGQVLTIEDALGNVTANGYDEAGNVATTTDPLGHATTYTHDEIGRLLTVRDPLGHETSYTYDSNDSVLSVTDPMGNMTSYEYNSSGDKVAIVDPLGRRTTYEYDTPGRVYMATNALGHSIIYAYDTMGRRTAVTDERGKVTQFEYDPNGNLKKITSPTGEVTRHAYDGRNNCVATTDPRGKVTSFVYDGLNRRVSTTDPLGNVVRTEYDAAGRVVATINARSKRTEYAYDAVGRLLSVRAPTGALLRYEYDALGRRTATIDPKGHITRFEYDAAGQLTKVTDPLGHVRRLEYDAAGNRIRRVDQDGRETVYAFDAANRLSHVGYSDGTSVDYTRDAVGNVTAVTDCWGTTSMAYDAGNRIVRHTDVFGRMVDYEYDPAGNRSRIAISGGLSLDCAFDDAGRMIMVSDQPGRAVSYEYDQAGNLTSIHYPNNVRTVMTYDDAERLKSVATMDGSGDTLTSSSYELDPNGNRTSTRRVDRRDVVRREGGTDQFDAAVSRSIAWNSAGPESLFLIAAEDAADAIGAGALARRSHASLLPIAGEDLNGSGPVVSEVSRLFALNPLMSTTFVGGEAELSPLLEIQLRALGISAGRLAGSSRAGALAAQALPGKRALLISAGERGREAAAAVWAARSGNPVLVSDRDSLPSATKVAIATLGVESVLMVGDTSAIGLPVEQWLASQGIRVDNRFLESDAPALSAALADFEMSMGSHSDSVALVNQLAVAEAMAIGAHQDAEHEALVLAPADSLQQNGPSVTRWLDKRKGLLQRVVLASGTSGLGAALENEIRDLFRVTVTEYGYSDLDELTSECRPGLDTLLYEYDAMGNRTRVVANGRPMDYVYDDAGRLLSAGGTTFAYDARGNRILRTAGTITTSYNYDAESRLISVATGADTARYDYDGQGIRLRSFENGHETRYVADLVSVPYRTLEAKDAGTGVSTTYVYGLELEAERGTDGIRYLHADGLGSVSVATDSTGTDVSRQGFRAFGAPWIELGRREERFGYVGRLGVEKTSTSLLFMRWRFYDPEVGMFLSMDPEEAEERDFLRMASYLYANGDPVQQTDADGRAAKKPAKPAPPKQPTVVKAAAKVAIAVGNTILKAAPPASPNVNLLKPATQVAKVSAGVASLSLAGSVLGPVASKIASTKPGDKYVPARVMFAAARGGLAFTAGVAAGAATTAIIAATLPVTAPAIVAVGIAAGVSLGVSYVMNTATADRITDFYAKDFGRSAEELGRSVTPALSKMFKKVRFW